MFDRKRLATAALMLAASFSAQAAPLAADGQWTAFDVAFDLSGDLGWIAIDSAAPLTFSFTVPEGYLATLTVVDAGFAGDRYRVTDLGTALGDTSAAADSYPNNVYLDFDAALADADYSRAVFVLGVGAHDIGGLMVRSARDDTGVELNSSVGGIRLTVSPVPEPATLASLLAGLGVLAMAMRRRTR